MTMSRRSPRGWACRAWKPSVLLAIGENGRIRDPAGIGIAERIAWLSAANVLERIGRARLQRDELDAELTLLIDHAASLGIGWPDIARCLCVSRQAAPRMLFTLALGLAA